LISEGTTQKLGGAIHCLTWAARVGRKSQREDSASWEKKDEIQQTFAFSEKHETRIDLSSCIPSIDRELGKIGKLFPPRPAIAAVFRSRSTIASPFPLPTAEWTKVICSLHF
jgi:hypothetical protein